jgi:hypothetical protein
MACIGMMKNPISKHDDINGKVSWQQSFEKRTLWVILIAAVTMLAEMHMVTGHSRWPYWPMAGIWLPMSWPWA